MASILKRKRNSAEVAEAQKRSKALRDAPAATPKFDAAQSSWDAAFNIPKSDNQLSVVAGDGAVKAPEVVDYEEYIAAKQASKSKKSKTKQASTWRTSEPVGGRMINVDPIFVGDEKYLIVAHRLSLRVYSTTNSLLIRSIPVAVDRTLENHARIVSYCQSPSAPEFIWVACSDGSIFRINWMSGEGSTQFWTCSSTGVIHMTVAAMEYSGQKQDVLFTTEKRREAGWRITAHELNPATKAAAARTIYSSPQPIQILTAAGQGDVIVAASEERVLVGSLRSSDFKTIDKMRYEFRVFESTDYVSSLDVRVSPRSRALDTPSKSGNKKQKNVVDVVVGDVKGVVFVHNDLLAKLIDAQRAAASGERQPNMAPRKLHWHRKAVHSVKWSLDGNYVISGGSETVLVLWQLDTGRQQFLPHLAATIENVVISPKGSSYAVHLGDNSTMVLSTAELTPTANIAGIQAHVLEPEKSYDSFVNRLKAETHAKPLIQRAPAVISPLNTSHLLLAVGETQLANPFHTEVLTAPYLQMFDIASSHTISRQALSRTNITNKNVAPNAQKLSEPRITHMQISHDGHWLATVDEWVPPRTDLEFLNHGGMDLDNERQSRREVFLKFWQFNAADNSWELVSRIDAPHGSATEENGVGRVLDLATGANTLEFSTIGEDGIVRIWSPKTRRRDGVIVRGKDGQALRNWSCFADVPLGKSDPDDELARTQAPANACVAFSDDGSILAAAVGGMPDGLLHLVDPSTGSVRYTRTSMYKGDLIKIAFLGRYLITVSDDIRVYDMVLDSLQWGISLTNLRYLLTLEQKLEMIHLAVDRLNNTFAVALPCREDWELASKKSVHSMYGSFSEIAIFDPSNPEPIYTSTLSSIVTALLPAASSAGYVVLDTSAELRTLHPGATQAVTLSNLPIPETEANTEDAEADSGAATDIMQLAQDDVEMLDDAPAPVDIDIDDDGPPVVSQQQLAAIFDVGPSFALPPIEEMFYQVTGLFSNKVAA